MTFNPLNRRELLYGLGASVGTLAFNAMLQSEEKAQEGPLAPKQGQFPTKIKSCIFLTMSGGPSHIDTFDPKPKLDELHLKEFQRQDKFTSAMNSGKRYYVASPFKFNKVGSNGTDMCEHWKHLPEVADD